MAQGEWRSTTRLINHAAEILEREHPMTVRQLFYRLVSAAVLDNCLRDYQRVSKAMTKARDDERISYDSSSWTDLAQLGNVLERECLQYRRDYWQDQPTHVEIWCEKDSVTGSIDVVREEYGLTVEAQRGFNSTTNVHNVATRLLQKKREGKNVLVFFLGDWDPSGAEIEADVRRRVSTWCMGELDLRNLDLRRLAILKQDIVTFNLPPLRVKISDSRAAGFLRRHGDRTVELDARPPSELRRRLRRAIEAVIDRAAWDRARVVEEAQQQTCKRYASVLKGMLGRTDLQEQS